MRTSFLSLLSSALCPVKNKCCRICLSTAIVASSESWYIAEVKRLLDRSLVREAAGGPATSVTSWQCSRTFQRISTVTWTTSEDAGSWR